MFCSYVRIVVLVFLAFSHCSVYCIASCRRTKRKPIHVISTTKRPVPLEHFLFTGNSTKTADELFKIVNEDGQFQVDG